MDLPGAGDADLARRIAAAGPAGAPEAEAELYRRMAPRVRLYGLRHLRDEQAAADLVQQALLVTIQQLRDGKVREPERLASFVLGVCRMVAGDIRRGRGRRERLLRRFATDVPGAGTTADEPRLDHDRLAACLESLGERERSVLLLTFHAERSAGEVAADLGLTAANVRVIRHRAIARLRDCMDAAEPRP